MSGLEVPPALWAVLAHGLRSGAGGQAAPAAYFVGGCVRDSLLGIPLHDLDLAVAGDPMAAARVLADAVQGHPFWLDPEGGVVRVAIQERPDFHVDVCRLKGSLEEDLLARDLTINALAIPLESGLTATDQVVDRCGGRDDLARGVIRFVSPAAPVQDPLRLLRALRFRWKLDFQLDPGTLSRLRECVLGLNRVSGERIRDELFQLLALPNPAAAVRECLELGLGPVLIGRPVPEAGPIVPDPHVVGRAEAALGHLAGRLSDGSQSLSLPSECRADAGDRGPRALLRERLERPAPSGRRRRELLFWIALLAVLQPEEDPAPAAERLALSVEERRVAGRALAGRGPAGSLLHRQPAPGRERLRFFQSANPAAPEAVLLAGLEGADPRAVGDLLAEMLEREAHPRPPLLSGQEIMELLGLRPGRVVGTWLQILQEAQADGLIATRSEAEAWLRARAGSQSLSE